MRPSCIAACAALGLWSLGGCTTSPPSTRIDASDSGATLASVRVSTAWEPSARPGGETEIEYTIATGKGSATQELAPGQDPIRFGDPSATFNPPQRLTYDFKVTSYDALWRRRLWGPETAFGLEFFAGPGYLTTDLSVASATQRTSDTLDALVFNAGLGVLWRLWPTAHLQARATFGLPVHDFDEFHRYEVNLVQALGRYASVRAGYASWRIRAGPDGASAIKLGLSGPSIGLDVHF